MKLKLYILVALTTTILNCNLYAQKKKSLSTDSTTVITFHHADGTITNNKSKPNIVKHLKHGEINIIKTAPLGFMSGVIPFYYEREIKEYLSLQCGIGFTTRNFSREIIQTANSSLDFYNSKLNAADIASSYYNFDNRTAGLGFMYSIQPRFYFKSDGLHGGFLGISFNNARFNFNSNDVAGYNGTKVIFGNDKHAEYENIKDFFVDWGHQYLFDKLSFEYTVELGARNVSGSKYVAYAIGSGSNYTIQDGMKDYSVNNLFFNIGLKLGYHF